MWNFAKSRNNSIRNPIQIARRQVGRLFSAVITPSRLRLALPAVVVTSARLDLTSQALERQTQGAQLFGSRLRMVLSFALLVCFSTVSISLGQDEAENEEAEFSAAEIEFFEKHIRPVLVEHCDACHSPAANPIQGGLLLSSREAMLQGGDSGAAIVSGKPDESLLLESLRYESFEMPPDNPLPDEVVDKFAEWVAMGAPDPRASDHGESVRRQIDLEAGRNHWAYQSIKSPAPPTVVEFDSELANVDRFIFSKFNTLGLAPASEADKITLLRRVTFDLTGLPPTPAEVDSFINDSRPDAYERRVDELLSSPRFGEHWGRHWLDLVRYAESITLRGFVLPQAWRYRDYVIDSFNQDRPYDEFLKHQLAGDLLPAESISEQRAQLTATAFLTLGNTNLEQQDKSQLEMDYIDEQLDVIGKALLAQTITCARCHDHKFDPIPTADYYGLAGILKGVTALKHDNVSKWLEQPLPLDPEKDSQVLAAKLRSPELKQQIETLKQQVALVEAKLPNLDGLFIDDDQAELIGEWTASKHSKPFLGTGYIHDGHVATGTKSARFELHAPEPGKYEIRFAYTSGSNRATNVPVQVTDRDGTQLLHINQRAKPTIDGHYTSLGEFEFSETTPLVVEITNAATDGHVIIDGLQIVLSNPVDLSDEQLAAKLELQQLNTKLEQTEQELAAVTKLLQDLPMTMAVKEAESPQDLAIHIRGNVHQLGDVVPRGVLKVIDSVETPSIPADQSGRKELAEWLVSPNHPLTSRVYANRIWCWIFGEGLVSSVDNFGTTGVPPSHPELLDYLASRLIDSGWSTKKLVKELVLSRTYRLAATRSQDSIDKDPDNRWFAAANLKRIPAESLRDTMLLASAELDLTMGGPTFPTSLKADYGFEYKGLRRGVYVPVFRNRIPELFQVFDFPNPSLVVGQRPESTSAPQALWMLNHPFAIDRSLQVAERLHENTEATTEEQMEQAYLLCLARLPNSKEAELAANFVQEQVDSGKSEVDAWATFVQVLFASPEFRYLK